MLGGVLGPKLKECWGFDCIYAPGGDYGCWADSLPGAVASNPYLYFYLANGTLDYWRLFRDFWEFAYGTPSKPEPQRMNNVFLAPPKTPALEALTDLEIFQSFEAIDLKQQQKKTLTNYEKLRLQLDQVLFDKKKKVGHSGSRQFEGPLRIGPRPHGTAHRRPLQLDQTVIGHQRHCTITPRYLPATGEEKGGGTEKGAGKE